MTATVNALYVSALEFAMSRNGAWTAKVEASADEEIESPVTLDLGALSLEGVVVPGCSGFTAGRATARLIGGAGGLDTVLDPFTFGTTPLRLALSSAVTGAGERLSATSSDAALAYVLPRWPRMRRTCRAELRMLAALVGASWRVLPDGSVWFGTESWAEVSPEHEIVEPFGAVPRVVIGVEEMPAELLPGTTFLGRRVETVIYRLGASRARVEVWS